MKKEVRLFLLAGTTEGRLLADFCDRNGIFVLVSVATQYGEALIKETPFVKLNCARLTKKEMEELLLENACTFVMDATHPYAEKVTENIREVCGNLQLPYKRILRGKTNNLLQGKSFSSIEEAAIYLNQVQGNILAATGSKELNHYQAVEDRKRIYVRILPTQEGLLECGRQGILSGNIIAMQGPFSKELNEAVLRQINAAYLVTKESGDAGGFTEKIDACLAVGVTPVIIRRPKEERGISLPEAQQELLSLCGKGGTDLLDRKVYSKREVTLIGTGPGDRQNLSFLAEAKIRSADLCIGARRMVRLPEEWNIPCITMYKGIEIADYIRQNKNCHKIAVLFSGDTGFYSGAKKLLEELEGGEEKDYEIQLLAGISTVAYFCSRISESWEDMRLVSNHGKQQNLLDEIRDHKKVFSLFGRGEEVIQLCKSLEVSGFGEVEVFLGENLSYPEERIIHEKASVLSALNQPSDLCAAIFKHRNAVERGSTFGVFDEAFLREKVPMTKEEVRWVCLAKLRLFADSIVYDIGAGTGSVSVEAALVCTKGHVYAIEEKPAAAELIKKNKIKLGVSNLTVINKQAPSGLSGLPKPTHAFIGGSSGNLDEILKTLWEDNRGIRIVINAISLETISKTTEIMTRLNVEYQAVTITIARSKQAGRYHLMQGENPITVFWTEGKKHGNP